MAVFSPSAMFEFIYYGRTFIYQVKFLDQVVIQLTYAWRFLFVCTDVENISQREKMQNFDDQHNLMELKVYNEAKTKDFTQLYLFCILTEERSNENLNTMPFKIIFHARFKPVTRWNASNWCQQFGSWLAYTACTNNQNCTRTFCLRFLLKATLLNLTKL